MRSLNAKLGVAAAALFLLSALTYWNDVRQAGRFSRGQKLLPNLNPDEVAEIVVHSAKETVTLSRSGKNFVVREVDGYRASNSAVNRLLKDLLDLGLAREVGSGAQLEQEVGIEPLAEEGYEVKLSNAAGQQMVLLRFGNKAKDGGGTFVQRREEGGGKVYLSESSPFIDTTARSYLDREILDVPSSDVVKVTGPDFVLARKGDAGALELQRPAGKGKASEISKLASFLNRLQFDKVYRADAADVADLAFDHTFRFDLKDLSGYIVSVADKGDRKAVKITGYLSVDHVDVPPADSSKEEVKEKADVLRRSDEINQFNAYHGSWVYELETFDGDKLKLRASALRE